MSTAVVRDEGSVSMPANNRAFADNLLIDALTRGDEEAFLRCSTATMPPCFGSPASMSRAMLGPRTSSKKPGSVFWAASRASSGVAPSRPGYSPS